MAQRKTLYLLFGVAAGVALGAALIGLFLMLIAIAVNFQADTTSVLTQHPLFVSGTELIFTSAIAGIPLFAIWYFYGRRKI